MALILHMPKCHLRELALILDTHSHTHSVHLIVYFACVACVQLEYWPIGDYIFDFARELPLGIKFWWMKSEWSNQKKKKKLIWATMIRTRRMFIITKSSWMNSTEDSKRKKIWLHSLWIHFNYIIAIACSCGILFSIAMFETTFGYCFFFFFRFRQFVVAYSSAVFTNSIKSMFCVLANRTMFRYARSKKHYYYSEADHRYKCSFIKCLFVALFFHRHRRSRVRCMWPDLDALYSTSIALIQFSKPKPPHSIHTIIMIFHTEPRSWYRIQLATICDWFIANCARMRIVIAVRKIYLNSIHNDKLFN